MFWSVLEVIQQARRVCGERMGACWYDSFGCLQEGSLPQPASSVSGFQAALLLLHRWHASSCAFSLCCCCCYCCCCCCCRVINEGATHLSTHTLGAVSCQAPEVMKTGVLSKQGDVYAFGMLSECGRLLVGLGLLLCCT
jgi:hypothetical protein